MTECISMARELQSSLTHSLLLGRSGWHVYSDALSKLHHALMMICDQRHSATVEATGDELDSVVIALICH